MPLILFFSILISCSALTAQNQYSFGGEPDESLIPYLKGRLYGFADTLGHVVIPPAYEEVRPFNPDGYSIVTQFGLNGVIDKKGNVVIDFFLQSNPSPQTTYFFDGKDDKPLSGCYLLKDDRSKRWALFLPGKDNPAQVFFGGKEPEYNRQVQQGYRDKWDDPHFFYGYKKAVLEDGRVNFIDTLGNLALKEPILNGSSLGEGRFSSVNEEGKVGIIDRNGKLLLPFAFSSIKRLEKSRFLQVKGKKTDYYASNYGIMDWSGKMMTDTVFREIKHLFGDYFSVNIGSRTAVLSSSGDTILPFQYTSINAYDTKYFIANKAGLDYALFPDGRKAIERGFEQLRPLYGSDEYQGKFKDTLFLYDKNLKFKVRFAGFLSAKPFPNGTYQLNKNQKNYLYDASGNPILPEAYDYMTYIGFGDAYFLQNKESRDAGVYRLGKGWVYPMGKYKLSLPADRIPGTDDYEYSLIVKEDRRELTFKGSFDDPEIREKPFDLSRSYRDGEAFVILPDGKEVSWPREEEIRPDQQGDYIWFTKEEGRNLLLLDTDLKPVFPEGVRMKNRRAVYYAKERLPLFVANDQEGEGLIDLEGKWVIEPAPKQRINSLGNDSGLFSIRDSEGAVYLCNEKGKALTPKGKYSEFRRKNAHVISATVREEQVYQVLFRPDGSPVSDEQYSEIYDTDSQYLSAGKNLDDYIRSCLLDSLGRELDCYPYAWLSLPCPHSDFLIAKDLYDFGLIDRKGKVILPFVYRSISCFGEDFFLLEKRKFINDLALSDGTIVQRDLKGYLRPQKVAPNRYLIKIETGFLLLDTKGKTIGSFEDQNIHPISQYAPYHEGYLKGKAPNGLEYYVSKRTGKGFWEE